MTKEQLELQEKEINENMLQKKTIYEYPMNEDDNKDDVLIYEEAD